MLIPTEAIATAPAISSATWSDRTPESTQHGSHWLSPGYSRTDDYKHVYPGRAGILELCRRGLSLLPRIFHSGVSCSHQNVPHASVSHYTTSPDSSGLRRPPTRTFFYLNGSFPSRPTPRSERLVCAAPAHPRTITLYGNSVHDNVTEPVYEYTHGTLPTQINHTIT